MDIIEFDGRPMPQGKQQENWVIDNNSCVNKGRGKLKNGNGTTKELLEFVYNRYSYHGFWGNYRSFLNSIEFENITAPSESIMLVTDVRIYKYYNKAKIDFSWNGSQFPIRGISMTDQEFYDKIDGSEVTFNNAYIIISIPKECDWQNPNTGEYQAYKFVSRVFGF